MFKSLLKRFMLRKSEILYKLTGIQLMYEDDYDELESWSEKYCNHVIWSMQRLSFINRSNRDSFICPWCALFGCLGSCGYAERHGACDNHNSTYSRIRDKLSVVNNTFVGQPAIKQLVFNTLCEYYAYLTIPILTEIPL